MADNSSQTGADTIRDRDRSGIKTQIFGLDLNPAAATETLMAGTMPIRDDPDNAVRAGRLFLGGSGLQTLTAAGNIRLAFTNPTGSGKTAYVYKLSGGGSALIYAHLYVNPTAGVPTAARPANNLYFGYPVTAVCALYADQNLTTALSGGADSGIDILFGANADTTFREYPIIIPAGVTLGVNIPFTGSGSGAFNLYWEEL